MDHIGTRIKIFREERGLTQTDVYRDTGGEHGGIKQTTLSSIESGTEPKEGIVRKLLQAYKDLNPDWLLLGDGPMLRDGKALTPIARTLPTPPDTEAQAQNVLLRELVDELKAGRLADRATIEFLQRELGKFPGSADAAGPTFPLAPRHPVGFGQAARARVAAEFDAYVGRMQVEVVRR